MTAALRARLYPTTTEVDVPSPVDASIEEFVTNAEIAEHKAAWANLVTYSPVEPAYASDAEARYHSHAITR